jgi:chemotaxis signal transduction protein
MNNHLANLSTNNPEISQEQQLKQILKLIVFTMGNLNLALPIESVYKVVNHTPVYSSGVLPVGVVHFGESEITVVDLYQRFFHNHIHQNSSQNKYLVVVQNTTGELYGIPVSETPVLMEVPSSLIRILPESYRRADTLDVASHVAMIPQETGTLTVFLLDVNLLLPIFQLIGKG